MRFKRGLIAGVLAGVVRGGLVFLKWKVVEIYYPIVAPFLPMAENTSRCWLIKFGVIDFLVGILFGLLYSLLEGVMPGKRIRKGLAYGFVIWMICEFPALFISFLTRPLPYSLMSIWLLSGVVISLLIGLIIALTYKNLERGTAKK